MNRRNTWLIIILLLAASLPLILLGISWFQNDKLKQQQRKKELFLLRIEKIKNEAAQLTEKLNDEFTLIQSNIVSASREQIRKAIRKSPSFKQLFIVSEGGEVFFPPEKKEQRTRSEQNTMQWLNNISSEIISFYQTPDENYSSKIFYKRGEKNAQHWFHFFHDEGINLILTKKISDKIYGVRINMRKVQSELIPLISRHRDWLKTSLIIIRDASGKELVRSGMEKAFSPEFLIFNDALLKPLNSWKIDCYVHSRDPVNQGNKSRLFFFLASALMILTVIITITLIFIREHRKAVNEALRKVSFVNRISHELRTPLTNIRMYAELLEDIVEENEKGEEFLKIILEETGRLMSIVENVLLFGRKERGVLKLSPVDFCIKSELHKTILFLDHLLKSSQLKIKIDIPDSINTFADPKACRQIFENLITNACKYSRGELCISFQLTNHMILLKFTDNGRGIDKKERKRIFEPFIRLSDAVTEKNSGTGLGLTIAKELAIKNGGDLYLTDYNKGAEFILKIPLTRKGDHK